MHDTVASPTLLNSPDAGKGQLLGLIEMFGYQFDVLRSFACGIRSFLGPSRIEQSTFTVAGAMDRMANELFSCDPDPTERSEVCAIQHATTGLAVSLRATINRLVTWDVQIKEFAQARLPPGVTVIASGVLPTWTIATDHVGRRVDYGDRIGATVGDVSV